MTSPRTSLTDTLTVGWIVETPARIGLTFAPGKNGPSAYGSSWRRDLGADLDALVHVHGARVLVPLLEDDELPLLGIERLFLDASARGLDVMRFPIADASVPRSLEDVVALVTQIVEHARLGRTVVIHCRGGLGRAGTIGGCVLAALGVPIADIFPALVRARGASCPETDAQKSFVRRFTTHLARARD